VRLILPIAAGLLLAACATKPQTTANLGEEMPLQPAPNDMFGKTLVYRAPDLDVRKYRGIYIPAAKIYEGADADWGNTDPAMRERVAERLAEEFRRVLRARGRRVLAAPAPGSVTLELTLAGITETRGVAANALKLTPVGIGITLLKSAADLPATFTGSITIAAKVVESRTDKTLAGIVVRESPTAIDPRTLGGTEPTAMLATTKAAEDFASAIDRAVQAAQ
jgi:hypothetical protein